MIYVYPSIKSTKSPAVDQTAVHQPKNGKVGAILDELKQSDHEIPVNLVKLQCWLSLAPSITTVLDRVERAKCKHTYTD